MIPTIHTIPNVIKNQVVPKYVPIRMNRANNTPTIPKVKPNIFKYSMLKYNKTLLINIKLFA